MESQLYRLLLLLLSASCKTSLVHLTFWPGAQAFLRGYNVYSYFQWLITLMFYMYKITETLIRTLRILTLLLFYFLFCFLFLFVVVVVVVVVFPGPNVPLLRNSTIDMY